MKLVVEMEWNELWELFGYELANWAQIGFGSKEHIAEMEREIKTRLREREAAKNECEAKMVIYSGEDCPNYQCGLYDAAFEINEAMLAARKQKEATHD